MVTDFAARLEAKKAAKLSHDRQMAQHVLSSTGMASLAVAGILKHVAPGADQLSLQAEIPALMQRLKSGDSSMLEEALMGQVLVLQTLANNLIAQGSLHPDNNQKQTLLNLGLKASNQLRQVVSTLNEIKNPRRAIFIKRQLNQLRLDSENSKRFQSTDNELLGEMANGTSMDRRAEAKTSRSYPPLKTLENEYRSDVE